MAEDFVREIGAAWRGAARPARAGAAGAPGCAPRPPRAADRQRAAAVRHAARQPRRIRLSAGLAPPSRKAQTDRAPENAQPGALRLPDPRPDPDRVSRIRQAGPGGEPSPPDRDRGRVRRCVDRQFRGDRRRRCSRISIAPGGPRRCWWRRSAPICRPSREAAPPPIGRPYFVYVSTIEARKNHLLLLNLWRRLGAEISGTGRRVLVLVGQRGWETENVIDMLDRCPALRGLVIEHNALPDAAMVPLLQRRARAAAAVFRRGVRVPGDRGAAARGAGAVQRYPGIARDRRRGAGIPRPARRTGLARGGARLRGAGIRRGARRSWRGWPHWQPPRWDAHFAIVDRFIAEVAASPARDRPGR